MWEREKEDTGPPHPRVPRCLLPALQRTTADDLGLGFPLLEQMVRRVGCVAAVGVGAIPLTAAACSSHRAGQDRAQLDINVVILLFLIMVFPLTCGDLLKRSP